MPNKNLNIINEPMELKANFCLTDLEVDCVAKVVFGKKKVITQEQFNDFIQVILEYIVLNGSVNKPTDTDWLKDKSASYKRGWAAVGKAIEDAKNSKEK